MRTKEPKTTRLAPSAGTVFADGIGMELVRNSNGTLGFLISDGHAPRIVDQFTHGKVTHTTPQVHPSACESLALPSGLAKFGSTRQLFDEVVALISRASGENQNVAVPLSFLVFASWLPENSPVPPFLWVVVPATCTAAALKQVLGLLCRHAIVVNLLSASWLSALPMSLQPTLIAEIDSPSRRLLQTLRASQSHGTYPTRAGQVIDPSCPKVIFSRDPLEDPAAAGFPLEVALAPAGEYVPPLDSDHAAQVAEEFQNRLLAYRLENFSRIVPPTFDLGRVSAPVQALAHSLAGAIVGDDELQAQIVPYLRQLNADVNTCTEALFDATLLEVLIHRWNDLEVGATELAGDVNTIFCGRGGSNRLSPEMIGWRLRKLGLRTTTISRGLKGLKLADIRPAIAKLALLHGLKVPENTSARSRRTVSRPNQISPVLEVSRN